MSMTILVAWLSKNELSQLCEFVRAWYDIEVTPKELADAPHYSGAFVANVVEKLQRLGLSRREALDAIEEILKVPDRE